MKDWHRKAAELYVDGVSSAEIAEAFSKHRDTVVRALQNAEVRAYVDELRSVQRQKAMENVGKHLEDFAERRSQAVSLSWDTLIEVLQSEDAPYSAKVSAATAILKGSGELVERQQMEHKGVFGVIVVDGD